MTPTPVYPPTTLFPCNNASPAYLPPTVLSHMDSDPRRRSFKAVRVLCDGCERASAVSYCTECNECACNTCVEQLHVRGRRQSKRSAARTCKGRAMKDLQKTVGVLALCMVCRTRPAYRYSNAEVYALCQECRHAYSKPAAASAEDIVKRAIAEELSRTSSKSSSGSSSSTTTSGASSSGGSRRRHKHSSSSHHATHSHHKSRRERKTGEDDSTGDDITDTAFSRESSTE